MKRPTGRVLFSEHRDYEVYAFLPAERGRYIRTHRCALVTKCPECHSEPGQPCEVTTDEGWRQFRVEVHERRRADFTRNFLAHEGVIGETKLSVKRKRA